MADESDDRNQSGDAMDVGVPAERPERRIQQQRGPDERPRAWQADQRNRAALITKQLPEGMTKRLPQIDAHCTYVLAYRSGELRVSPTLPGFGVRAGTVCGYVVDLAPRQVHGTLLIPARVSRYSFEATYDAQWQVADPIQVVRANVHDGDATVAGFLRSRLGAVGRQFEPDDSAGVEGFVYTVFGAPAEAGGLVVGNGLALIALNVQVTPDPIVSQRGVRDDDSTSDARRVELRARQLRPLLDSDGAAFVLHLAQNPDDTQPVLQMIMEARDRSEQRRLEWLDRMRTDDAIQEADYEHARRAVLYGGTAPLTTTDGGPFGYRPSTAPPMIDSGAPAVPRRADNPFPSTGGAAASTPPTPVDENPYVMQVEPRPAETPPPDAPRDVRADRHAAGSVLVRWREVGDVTYRVRRFDGDEWVDVATTKGTFAEDHAAPPGAVPVYSVSAEADGLCSAEARSRT